MEVENKEKTVNPLKEMAKANSKTIFRKLTFNLIRVLEEV